MMNGGSVMNWLVMNGRGMMRCLVMNLLMVNGSSMMDRGLVVNLLVMNGSSVMNWLVVRSLSMMDGLSMVGSFVVNNGFVMHWSMSSLVMRLGVMVSLRVSHMVGLVSVMHYWNCMSVMRLFVMGVLHVVNFSVGVGRLSMVRGMSALDVMRLRGLVVRSFMVNWSSVVG